MCRPLTTLLVFLLGVTLPMAEPLTTEGVVRLFASGEAAERIIAIVEQSDPDFDLSPGMLQELRAARVPENVIRAMRLRQQRAAPLTVEQTEASSDGQTLASVTLEGATLGLKRRIPNQLAVNWELADTEEDRTVTDLAIYIVCLSPDHVPDQWRRHTPMGRDFHGMPRHRLIGFYSAGDDEQSRRLRFQVPETVGLVIPEEAPHDLSIGIAAHAGGAFRRLTDDIWKGVDAATIDSGLRATVGGNSLMSLRARFTDKPSGIRGSREP